MPIRDFESDSGLNRILRNGSFITLRFLVYAFSGILFIPFLVKHYGAGSYGLIALAGFLTQYVGMISSSFGSSVARFLNVALNKNDWRQAGEIFSTAIVANIGFVLIQIPLFTFGVWNLDWIIKFAPEVSADFHILVMCNIVVFFISMLTGILLAPIQASNRIDISAKIDALRLILRLILLVSLILWLGPALWIIGVVDVVLALVNAGAIYKVYRHIAPDLIFDTSLVTKRWIRPVFSMSGWSLLVVLGFALFLKTDIWLINRFITPELAGIYAAFLLFPNFIKQICGQFSSLINPVLLIDYAKGNLERVAEVCSISYRIVFVFSVSSACFFALFSTDFLELLFPGYIKHANILYALIFASMLSGLGDVLRPLFKAYNKMHQIGIVYLITGVSNIVLSFVFIKLGLGVLGVILGTGISILLRDLIFCTILAGQLLDKGSLYLFRNTYMGFSLLIVFLTCQILFNSKIIGMFILLIFGVLILFLEKEMRLMCVRFLKRKF